MIINAEGVKREGLWEYGKPKNLDWRNFCIYCTVIYKIYIQNGRR